VKHESRDANHLVSRHVFLSVLCVQYAAEHNLPSYRNLLVPRVTGFTSCVKMLGSQIDAIYDFTLCYTNRYHHLSLSLLYVLGKTSRTTILN
jgi:hypothetical protein